MGIPLDFGPSAGAIRFSRYANRTESGQSGTVMRYPSPFFDIAQQYLPSSFKTLLRWCRYYFLTNPLVNAVNYKMAEYPVTDWIFESKSEPVRKKWSKLFEDVLNFKKFEVEAGLDYNVYGNCFISIYFPFRKMLRCKACGYKTPVDKQQYSFIDFRFTGACKKCENHNNFDVQDHYLRSARELRLIRWNPENITVQHNEVTSDTRYYYTIPPTMANDIRMGKRHIIEHVPQVFIEALRENKALLFSRENIYHMRRPTIAQKDKGWGMPMVLPVLKDVFYLQILRKAQEAIAVEHIVPMRILFPQSASQTSDVYSTVNLSQWRDKIEQEVLRWRLDNNYIPILPLPVGSQTLGGDGRALMLAQEYRVWGEHIIAGMGVPVEFVYGGMQYSGSNVSMRILENHFLDQKTQRKQLLRSFLIPAIAHFMGWPEVDVHAKKFKMADDLQRSAFYLQLNQAGKLSDKSLLEDTDWDSMKERENIATEQKQMLEQQRSQALAQAAIQGESQLTMAKYQMRGQKLMMEQSPEMAGMGMPAGQPMPTAGIPGQASPMANGQMMNQQGAMMAQAGQLPGMEIPPSGAEGGTPAEMAQQGQAPEQAMSGAQSPLVAEQQGGGFDVIMIAQKVVGWLNQLPDHEKQQQLSVMRGKNPQLYSLVIQLLQESTGAERSSAGMPAPEQRAPRRGPEATTV
jgi:hypothetical protein